MRRFASLRSARSAHFFFYFSESGCFFFYFSESGGWLAGRLVGLAGWLAGRPGGSLAGGHFFLILFDRLSSLLFFLFSPHFFLFSWIWLAGWLVVWAARWPHFFLILFDRFSFFQQSHRWGILGVENQRNSMIFGFSDATVTQMRAARFQKPKEFYDFKILRCNSHTDEST